jgi:hypothetical protein
VSVEWLWLLANRIANCDCFALCTRVAPITPITLWAVANEYWNTPDRGHLIAASLTLDGVACEDLP